MTATHVHALMLRCALPLALLCVPLDVALRRVEARSHPAQALKKKR